MYGPKNEPKYVVRRSHFSHFSAPLFLLFQMLKLYRTPDNQELEDHPDKDKEENGLRHKADEGNLCSYMSAVKPTWIDVNKQVLQEMN